MKTLTEKYRGVLNESFTKAQFVRDARMAWPQLINQFTGFNDAVTILKQKGMISEADKAPEYAEFYNLSDEAIRRGIDAELETMGLMSQDTISAEDQAKAKEKALKNLKKNPLHYLNLISGESNKVDKHDQMVEPNEKNKVDVFNGMKKADLKENKTLREMTVDLLSYLKKEKGADNEMIKDFIKTHFNDIKGMSLDQIGDEFDEFVSVNYEHPSDYMDEALSDEDMKAIEKYGHADKTVKPFKPGDMYSTDFDYEGMLEFGLKIRLNTPIATLQALYDSFEDVNYHSENSHLGMAIDAIKDGDKSEALDHIRNFKKEVKKTLIGINEGADPSRKQIEEGEAVVSERVGALQDFISLIQDRAEDSGFSEAEEAEEVVYAIGDHYNFGVDIMHAPNEAKGKDHDGDGDIDGDDYMAAKDKAIKKAMGKKANVNEAVKNIITKILEEQTLNEAATNELARIADEYGSFEGLKPAVIALQNIVTEIESFYDKTRAKVQKVYDDLGEVRNDEGLKVGAFITPSIENAFVKDLKHITKQQFHGGLDMPKVKVLSQADLYAARMGGPVAEAEPKQTVYSPVNEKK
jgi:hypothetical protein